MRELSPPPSARSDPNATEMLRLWAVHRKLDVSINIGVYADQGFDEADAWGIIMSDFAATYPVRSPNVTTRTRRQN